MSTPLEVLQRKESKYEQSFLEGFEVYQKCSVKLLFGNGNPEALCLVPWTLVESSGLLCFLRRTATLAMCLSPPRDINMCWRSFSEAKQNARVKSAYKPSGQSGWCLSPAKESRSISTPSRMGC